MTTEKNPFRMAGPWFKGNLHLHTSRSDGELRPETVAQKYAAAGYDFIAITDHWQTFRSNGDRQPLLILNGVELDGRDAAGRYFHVLVVGPEHPIPQDTPLVDAIAAARQQKALVIWAHPHWTGNTVAEARGHGFDGLEIYNHGCQCEIGKGYATAQWDEMLETRSEVIGIATDDAHFTADSMFWKGGWVMVDAPRCERTAILEALRQGRLYASQGPSIHSLEVERDQVQIRTSPIRFARLVGPRCKGEWIHHAREFTEAAFRLPAGWDFVRLEIENAEGRRAWTNALPACSRR